MGIVHALIAGSGLLGAPSAMSAPPKGAEMALRDAWVKQNFARAKVVPGGAAEPAAAESGLLVVMNHGPILRNGRPDGRRIKLADTEYTHGLICHARSKVVVRLPGPGSRLTARVGVDAHAGGGSVIFSVRAGDREAFRNAVAEFRRVAPYMLGDFHPLTPYSLKKSDWIAWQYDCPEKGEGAVQAFRRDDCTVSDTRLKLRGLDARATYAVEDLDTGSVARITGRDLVGDGLTVAIASKPGSALFLYKKVK